MKLPPTPIKQHSSTAAMTMGLKSQSQKQAAHRPIQPVKNHVTEEPRARTSKAPSSQPKTFTFQPAPVIVTLPAAKSNRQSILFKRKAQNTTDIEGDLRGVGAFADSLYAQCGRSGYNNPIDRKRDRYQEERMQRFIEGESPWSVYEIR